MDGKKIDLKAKKIKKIDSKLLSSTITIGLIFLLIICLYFYFHYYFFGGRITSYVDNKKLITILFLGQDETNYYLKTDTMMIGLYNPQTKRFGLISLPRDLKIEIQEKIGSKNIKINSVYSKYGIKKLFTVIKKLTGLDINFYAAVDISTLVHIVDLIGGIDLYIDKPMKYIDKSADLYIDLPAGIIKCDGLKAMQFIRYRSDERSDIGRMERQYEFILNLIKKAIYKNNVLSNLKLFKIIYNKIKTNLNFSDIINLIKYTSAADFNNIEMIKVPGKFVNIYDVEYIEPDIDRTIKMTRNLLSTLSYTKADYFPQEIKVQVLNGSGKVGIAKQIRDKLVRNGFNVIEFGNTETQNYENMLILNRSGNMKKALKVADILKCNNVYPKIDKFIMIDVTVIVGQDYKKHL